MRILYGVNGEGMGHATRSEVVIGSLLGSNDVRVVASGAAFRTCASASPASTRSSAGAAAANPRDLRRARRTAREATG